MKSLLSLPVLLFFACSPVRYTADRLPERRVEFGTGGGFSGMETAWILSDNGQMWKRAGVGAPLEPLSDISRHRSRELIDLAETHLFGEVALNETRNTYAYVEFHSADRASRITWSGARPAMDPEMARLLDDLFSLIPTN